MARSAPEGSAALTVLVNESAGLGRGEDSPRVERALRDAGVEARIRVVPPPELRDRILEVVRAGEPVIAVAGGDGTLLTAAETLAGGETALAPIPTGTLNHFARRIGLPDLPRAISALRSGFVELLPLGIMDDRVFLNTATFGAYADVVRLRERFRRRLGKWPAAAVAFALTAARRRQVDVTLVVDGHRLRRRTPLVWVGVGWGSFPFVHESPDRRAVPELEIVVVRPRGAVGSAGLLLRGLLRYRRRERPVRDPALEVLHARELLIQGTHRIGVTLDGEVLRCEPPIFVALQPQGIRVASGRGSADPRSDDGGATGPPAAPESRD